MQDRAITELRTERAALEQRLQQAEAKLGDVAEQNRLLHAQLSSLAEQQAAGREGGASGARQT